MSPPAGAPAFFIADTPGLDFLNSIATPVDVQVDWLADGAGLVEWLRQAGLVDSDVLDELAARAMPGELDRLADQARDLRDWFREFVLKHRGRKLTAEALHEMTPINRLLERDEGFGRLVARDETDAFAFERARRWRTPEMLLLPIGEAIAQTIVEEDFSHVKACQGHKCTLLFADRTRARGRRWCSMSICGNRAKVAAHRHRQKRG